MYRVNRNFLLLSILNLKHKYSVSSNLMAFIMLKFEFFNEFKIQDSFLSNSNAFSFAILLKI